MTSNLSRSHFPIEPTVVRAEVAASQIAWIAAAESVTPAVTLPTAPVTAAAVATATVYTGVEAVVVTVTPAGHLVIAAAGAVPAPVAVHLDGCTFPLDAP